MKQIFFLLLSAFLSLLICTNSPAQITVTGRTNTTPNLANSYTTLASAINALNTITGISGPVIITLNAGYAETAPAGGYAITFTAATTDSNSVTIDGSSGYDTIVANNNLTAGALNDAMFKIIGSDHVTITRFTLLENAANTITTLATNNMTEWGIALLRRTSSTTDGAQYNSIIDNNISLNRTYSNSFGIYSNVRHTPTAVGTTVDITNISGSNLGNKIYNNRISNVNMGIALIGSSTDSRMDDSNDVGGTSSATGNTITNWGGTSLPTGTFAGNMSSEYYGILMRCQKNDNTSWNTVTSSTLLSGSVAAIVRGIHKGTTTGTVTGSFSTTMDHNTVTITDNLPSGSSSVSRLDGIVCTDKLADGILSISDNTVMSLSVTGLASGRTIRPISNSASAGEIYIDRNIIKGNTTTASAAGGWFIAIDQTGTVSNIIEINYNLIGDNASTTPAITYSATANSATIVRGINNDPATNPTGTASISITGNTLYGFVQANSPGNGHIYINCDHTTTTNSDMHIDGNHFVNIDAHVSGDISFISSAGTMAASAGAQLSVSNNDIVGTFTKSLGGGDVYIYNANGSSGTGNTMTESGNNFSNISLSGAAIMHGWYNNEGVSAAGPEKDITDNVFDTWTCSTSGSGTSNGIYCNWASGNSEISGNTISNITGAADVNGILSASTTATELKVSANNISGLNTTGSSSTISGINFTATSALAPIQHNVLHITSTSGGTAQGISLTSTTPSTYCKINYNSIYMQATSSTSSFNTRALYLQANVTSTTARAYVRNNILMDLSTPGASGLSTAIRRSSTSLANYDGSSNNNVLYSGAVGSSQHLVFYDGTNSLQTLAFYQSRLTSNSLPLAEQLSLQQLPVFDAMLGFPQLSRTGNCKILNGGNNSGIELTPDIDGVARMIIGQEITDIGADQLSSTNNWTGAAGNLWATAGSWSLGIVPNDVNMNVYIPDNGGVQPLIVGGETFQVDDVLLDPNPMDPLLIYVTNDGWLQIAGEIQGPKGRCDNDLSGGNYAGSIEMNGTCGHQLVQGDYFIANAVKDFKASNNVDISTVTGQGLDVYGELSFGGSNWTLTSSPLLTDPACLTMKSAEVTPGVFSTANVAQIASTNFIDGYVTVERYINTGQGTGQHTKKWQLLATPTGANSMGQSVYQSWQEGGNNTSTGYGTHIADTRINWAAEGFDAASANSDNGINVYNTGTQVFDPIPSPAGTSTPLYNNTGYFLFVRGDRSLNQSTSTPNPTNMRSKGALFQPHSGYVPTDVSVPATSPTSMPIDYQFAMIGNPYASAIDISYMDSHSGYFNNLTNDVYVWDPLLAGAHGLGGYQTLVESLGYQAQPGTTALYDLHTTSYPEIQSGQAFFMTTNANLTVGSVHFDEAIKSPNNRLVTRNADISNKTVLKARLYFNQNITDGNVVIFDKAYSNGFDTNDAVKFPNPGENFMIKTANRLLAAEARQPVSENDSIFYELKNIEPLPYQLQFVPENFNAIGLQAVLIDNYLQTKTPLSLNENSTIEFNADNNKGSYEHRFIVVFKNSTNVPETKATVTKPAFVIYPNPVSDRIINIRPIDQATGIYGIQLVSRGGQVVYNGTIEINDAKTTNSIKIGKIATGNYDVIITANDGKKSVQQILIK